MCTTDKPNILFMFADDLGWADVSCHGSAARTPNIDRLAREGIELTQHYVCPVCTPSRTQLLTGRYASRFGRHATVPSNDPVLPDGYETLATALRDNGYDTGLFGKWHLGSAPEFCANNYGFNTSYGSMAGGVDPYSHRYKRGPYSYTWHRNGQRVDERGHVTDLIVREAVSWIDSREEGKPWFCYVPFTAVHTPIKAPQHWIDRYASETFDDDPVRDRSYRTYAAYTSQMDAGVGQLVEAVARACQLQDTIIIFASDNGAPNRNVMDDVRKYPGYQPDTPRLGSNLPFRGGKGQFYEGGVRTPACLQWQGTLTPGTIDTPICIVDWMPTFMGLIGGRRTSDPQWDGIDNSALLRGEQTATDPERTIFWNMRGKTFALRRGNWKLIVPDDSPAPELELYNIAEDPHETTDMANEEAELAAELFALVAQEREADDSSKRPDVE